MAAITLCSSVGLCLATFLSEHRGGISFSDTEVGQVLALSIGVSNFGNMLANSYVAGVTRREKQLVVMIMESLRMIVAGVFVLLSIYHTWLMVLAVSILAFGTSGEAFRPQEEVSVNRN